MSHTLTLNLSESVFRHLQQQSTVLGMPPEALVAALLEQKFEPVSETSITSTQSLSSLPSSSKFEQCFGSLPLMADINMDNESIDADLAREYASSHEAD